MSVSIFDNEHRQDRQVSRTYEQIKKDIIRTRNRLHREVDLHGIDDQFLLLEETIMVK